MVATNTIKATGRAANILQAGCFLCVKACPEKSRTFQIQTKDICPSTVGGTVTVTCCHMMLHLL
jgi:hypothetical protein